MGSDDHSDSHASSSCEHGHDDTPLPRNALVITSGALLTIGILLHWLGINPDIGGFWSSASSSGFI